MPDCSYKSRHNSEMICIQTIQSGMVPFQTSHNELAEQSETKINTSPWFAYLEREPEACVGWVETHRRIRVCIPRKIFFSLIQDIRKQSDIMTAVDFTSISCRWVSLIWLTRLGLSLTRSLMLSVWLKVMSSRSRGRGHKIIWYLKAIVIRSYNYNKDKVQFKQVSNSKADEFLWFQN